MPVVTLTKQRCQTCGHILEESLEPERLFHPWHIRDQEAVRAYVESLGTETHEWLLTLYVDTRLNLLAVDTVARGDVSSCPIPFWHIFQRGHALGAHAFLLVHNHPSGLARASSEDIRVTKKLQWLSRELDLPLLDHLIIAGNEIIRIDCH